MLLVYVSLMGNNAEHLSMCLFAIHVIFLEKSLFRSFYHFYWVLFSFFIDCFERVILNTNALSDKSFANIFSQSVPCFFIFLIRQHIKKISFY